MLKIEHDRWEQSLSDLLERAIHEDHPRVRERYLALYLMARGEDVQDIAPDIGKHRIAVAQWCHLYNEQGPDALHPEWPGTHPDLTPEEFEQLHEALLKHPRESGFNQGTWTGKLVSAFVKNVFRKTISLYTGINYMHRLGLSRKRPRKKLKKGAPKAQKKFAKELQKIEDTRCHNSVTAYVDEGQIWQDAKPALMWAPIGEPAEIPSTSPGKKKILFYSAICRPSGLVITKLVDKFNSSTTIGFLERIRKHLSGTRIDLVWDNVKYHLSKSVGLVLDKLHIHEHRLPPYSPMMNADEYLIRWAKEVISNNTCWEDKHSLQLAFAGFSLSLLRRPQLVVQRCVPEMFGFHVK